MKALVLVNGELDKPGTLRRRVRKAAFGLVLGADRGARYASALNVTLNAIVGDLDSIPEQERQQYSRTRFITHPAEKDETDLELALLYASEQGADHIVIVGALGGRMDMTVSNLMLMNNPGLVDCRVEVWHGDQTGWLIRPPGGDIHGRIGDTVSLVPVTGDVSDVVTTGMKYPLRKERLFLGKGRGLSNILETSLAHVSLSEGLLLAVHTPGRA
jgi:thiamine pyrophosphokinase